MSGNLTKAQRRMIQHVADNPGRLRDSHSRRDFPLSAGRRDVLQRLWFGDLIAPPRVTESGTWELTEAGRDALARASSI